MATTTLEPGSAAPPSGGGLRFGFRWVILSLLFLGITLNYIDRLVVGFVFTPEFKEHFGITPDLYGYIGGAFAISYACGQLFSGWMLDKIGTRIGYSLSLAAWSICAMLTAFGNSWISFAMFRSMLGVAESPSYPGAAKICAEWFPQRQRSFAFGWVNAGANMAAILTPLLVPVIIYQWGKYEFLKAHPGFVVTATNPSMSDVFFYGWQAAFFVTGGLGLLLLCLWIPIVRRPEHHPMVSKAELELIQSDPPQPTKKVPWGRLLGYRQTYVLVAGKVLPDGIWWFFMTWLPAFFYDEYHLDIKSIGWPLVAIYLMADVGSVLGGGMSSWFIRRGMSVNKGRKLCMLICGSLVLLIILAPFMLSIWKNMGWGGALWPTVIIVGIAVAGHQGFSSNLYTLCSDMFPKRAVASVAGMAGFCGYIGATVFSIFVGYWVKSTHNYIVPFLIAGTGYVLSLAVMHLISPDFKPAIVDDEPQPAFPVEPSAPV